MNLMEMIVSAIVGGLISLFINEILGNPVSMIIISCKRKIRKIESRLFHQPSLPSDDFSFGKQPTTVYTLDCKSDKIGISTHNIHIVVDPDQNVCEGGLKEVEYYCSLLQTDVKTAKKETSWNGRPLSLREYSISRTAGDESNEIWLTLLKNQYYITRVITNNLQEPCPVTGRCMSEYIDSFEFGQKNTYVLPNSIGVCFLVETKDGQVIFSRRGRTAGFRPGEWDVSVVEGLEEKKDAPGNRVDIKAVFLRAFKEEICNIEDKEFDFRVLGLVFDKKYGQWNFIGEAYCALTEKEIRSRRANGDVEDKWELQELSFQKNDLKSIMNFLSTHRIWDMGLVTVYYALLTMGNSRDNINKAIDRYYSLC